MITGSMRGSRTPWPVAASLGVALTLGLGGCAAEVGSEGSPDGADPLRITFVAGVKGDPFYITMMCGAQEEAEKLGAMFDFQAPASFSPTDQIPIVEGVAAAQPDILLIAPTDDTAMFTPIKQVADGGTKVVFVDTNLQDPSISVAQVATDDYQGGVEAATELAELVGGSGQVLLLNFQPGVSTTEARGKGFIETAEKLGLEVVAHEYGGTEIEKSAAIVEATLQKAPDLAGIFTTTDFGAQGAVTALRAAGELGEVKIVGFDASPVMVQQLEAGEIQTIVSQQARKIAQLGVQQAVAALNGEDVTETIRVETVTITKDDLASEATRAALQSDSCG